jgi:hypothetical protein
MRGRRARLGTKAEVERGKVTAQCQAGAKNEDGLVPATSFWYQPAGRPARARRDEHAVVDKSVFQASSWAGRCAEGNGPHVRPLRLGASHTPRDWDPGAVREVDRGG